ncbi:4-coumarate--CoA ligase-like 9 [Papaver somniferum]|uniref:4-coumarate--CoA ligase-like 9 n=1 Tax=Papaver somniferum TaxID=3469 RepID=UPI000E6F6A68|nr:4-coumarate--CoA ligase-like 9 [Papaver somniferum]XP_026448715.1 4-coumarate--CoA ligase-like 9 [Papaver somniferum]XP_026448716.1 4-coumarate--CoA ligase-like 9 [Papaver somniferum]
MAKEQTMMIDPKSGFCSETKIYHSLLPAAPLPPATTSLSISDYVLSLLHQHYTSSTSDFYPGRVTAFIESETGDRVSYSEFLGKIESLTHSLKSVIGLSKGDTAFILSPATPQIPVLYLSLLSIGVIVSPSNPISTATEISHQINLCKPAISFGTSETTHKLPSVLRFPTIVLDSQNFRSMMHCSSIRQNQMDSEEEKISQSDTAAILYSSGTTGRVKGVTLSHRNLIASVAEVYAYKQMLKISTRAVNYSTVPLFHIYGFTAILESVTMADTFVIPMKRFDFSGMLKAIEKFKVTVLAAAPPVILAMTKCQSATESGGILDGYDLSSVEGIRCGGSPLRMEVIVKFGKLFPNIAIRQGYGITEAACAIFRAADAWDCRQLGSTGKLVANMQVKIVDPTTGVPLPPCKQGELWAKGPSIMEGYLGEGAEGIPPAIDSEGWLKTGDLCYVDNEGFLYVVDRLKELIKYKGYQVPPAELEELLLSHPDILDAAVIPYPDEEAGEVPMAFVVRKPQTSIDKTRVIDFISKQVAPYKKIRRVEFIDFIPKNAPGKILRKELKTRALSKMLATTTSKL